MIQDTVPVCNSFGIALLCGIYLLHAYRAFGTACVDNFKLSFVHLDIADLHQSHLHIQK